MCDKYCYHYDENNEHFELKYPDGKVLDTYKSVHVASYVARQANKNAGLGDIGDECDED